MAGGLTFVENTEGGEALWEMALVSPITFLSRACTLLHCGPGPLVICKENFDL
jgi:hypothetical protein